MDKFRVVLTDGTIGDIVAFLPGDMVEIELCDENGNKIFVTGKIEVYL